MKELKLDDKLSSINFIYAFGVNHKKYLNYKALVFL